MSTARSSTDGMRDVYTVLLLHELAAAPTTTLEAGRRVRVLGELGSFPVHRLFGVLCLDGGALLVDFEYIDGGSVNLAEYNLYNVLGEICLVREVPALPTRLLLAAASMGASCEYFLKARYARSMAGLDVLLYKQAELSRRAFLRERQQQQNLLDQQERTSSQL